MVQKENEKKLKEGIVKMKENQSMKDEIVQLMDRKFKEYDRQITQTIKAEIMASNKLNLNSIKDDSKKQKQGKTFADATKDDSSNNLIPQFRKLLQDEKLQEIEEERQKELRQPNLIIFGVKEGNNEIDEKFVNGMVKDVHVKGIGEHFKNFSLIGVAF